MELLKQARSEFRRILVALAIFSLFINILMLTMPLYMLQIYDRVLPSRSTDTLTFLSIIAVGALIVLGMLEAVRSVIAVRAGARLDVTLSAAALSASIENGRKTMGDIQAMRDLATVRSVISSRIIFALLDLPFAPLFIGLLYFIHPHLFFITLFGAVVLAFIAVLNQWAGALPNFEAGKMTNISLQTAQAYARNSDSLQAMGMTGKGIAVWGKSNAAALQAQDTAAQRGAMFTGLSRTIRMGLQIAILGYGGYLVLNGQMTAGMIFASSIISGRGLQPIDQVIGGWRQYVSSWAAWKRLSKFLAESTQGRSHTKMPALKGQITADSMVVIPPGANMDNALLKRVSFVLQPGESMGVVGPSGAGKSTLVRVLAGSIELRGGTLRLDGADISNWDHIDLGKQIGYLSQEVELLPGTVAENIARLDTEADSKDILDAAQKAQVHDLILKLPQGYDTRLGPGGFTLSGGQRQRIALARAFYGNPKLLILDEPNANLDEEGDIALERALKSAKEQGTTVILVTQRPQALKTVDKILRLHSGSVDFFGTRDEFVAKINEMKQKAMQQQQAGRRPPNGQGGMPQRQGAAMARPPTIDNPKQPDAHLSGKKKAGKPTGSKANGNPLVKASFAPQMKVKP